MKLFVCSDLHIDRLSPDEYHHFTLPESDAYLIAGDLMNGVVDQHYKWLLDKTAGVPTYISPGNHDYYGSQRSVALAKMRQLVAGTHAQIVCDQAVQLAPGLQLWASDFWTDMQISGSVKAVEAIARTHWHDFDVIEIEEHGQLRLLEPQDTVKWHQSSLAQYRQFAEQTRDQIILMTHHGIVTESLVRDLNVNALNAEDGFRSSELRSLILDSDNPPLLAINGHIHEYNQQALSSFTQLYSNPRGNVGQLRTTILELTKEHQHYQVKFIP